jgi:hypothetical protein
VAAIRQHEAEARSEVAKALTKTGVDARIASLVESLAGRPFDVDITDAEYRGGSECCPQAKRLIMLRVAIDTNLWIRPLLGGRIIPPVLEARRDSRFTIIVCQPLVDELDDVWQHLRPRERIKAMVAGDAGVRSDDDLRAAMERSGLALWGADRQDCRGSARWTPFRHLLLVVETHVGGPDNRL